jgi:hypothetical protein
MAFKPAFTGDVDHSGDTIMLTGVSEDDPPGDLLGIRVVLAQGAQIASGVVADLAPQWHVEVGAAGFKPGDATVFAVESHLENATTITWAQTIKLPASLR